ncbi:uncharacterized protein EMH_0040240 [Eimeria mitis]|uniref:Uncharacterized protein n=1 Tax=Eimeria mitis TaxID=44415 RepID=U6K1N8_9EIME|nr:uncharacterized protein EMH_0040240 [Eimeria mitis]CDJ31660.1 hypothetical protein, conserved [Eimeria mitis]
MQEAIRLGDLPALRAEAALLSLISRALGFVSLSVSARRVADICDLKDAGVPNPAWGPHHPLVAAQRTDISHITLGETKWAVQQQQLQHQRDHQQERVSSCSSHYSGDAAVSGWQPVEGASVSGCRGAMTVASGAYRSNKAIEVSAIKGGLVHPGVPQADIVRTVRSRSSSFAEGCKERPLPKPAGLVPHQHTQQHSRRPAQRNTSWSEHKQDKLAQEQQHGYFNSEQPPERQELERHRLLLDNKQQASHAHYTKHDQQQQKLPAADYLGGLHSPTSAFGEAVAVCFMDLHAAKAKLAPLFQEGTAAAAATACAAATAAVAAAASAAAPEDEASAQQTHNKSSKSRYLEILRHSLRVFAAVPAAVRSSAATTTAAADFGGTIAPRGKTPRAAKTAVAAPMVAVDAAITTAKAALRLAAVWGRTSVGAIAGLVSAAAHDAVAWLSSSFSGTWMRATHPTHLVNKVSEKATSTAAATSSAASSVAAAIVTAQKKCTECPQRAAVLLEQCRRTVTIPGAIFSGPAPIGQVSAVVGAEASRRWDSLCYFLKQITQEFTSALQKALRLLILWDNSGLGRLEASAPPSLRQDSSCSIRRSLRCRNSGCRRASASRSGSPRATPEGVRQRGSTSTCYWSPIENTSGLTSPKEPAESPVSDILLPASQQQETQQAQLGEQQVLLHHLNPLCSPFESVTPSTPHVAFHGPAASANFLNGTLPAMRFTGLDNDSKHSGGGLQRGKSFRTFPKVGGTTRAAAAGAAAAAATASWGTAVSLPQDMRSQGPHRQVSFQTGNEENPSTQVPLQTVIRGLPRGSQSPGVAQDREAQMP